MSVVPHLARAGEVAPPGTLTYWCPKHGQTLGAWHCAGCSPPSVGFGDATAAQIGTQELNR